MGLIAAGVEAHVIDRPGGIFVRRADHISAEDRLLLQEAIDSLKGQQQQILRLRFNEGKTQTEIADHIGVSQMHVSRLLRRAIEDLRVELEQLEQDREETTLTTDGAHAE